MAPRLYRLMHHCHVVSIRGNSYRVREFTDLWQAIQPGEEKPAANSSKRQKKKEAMTN